MQMFFDCFETFRTEYVFHFTGILCGRFLIEAQLCQPAGEEKIALIYFLGYMSAGSGERNKAAVIDFYKTVLP